MCETNLGFRPTITVLQKGDKGDKGDPGNDGLDGNDGESNTILNGIVDPTTEGEDGDFYINTNTSTIFGPKNITWPTGVSLVGIQGPQGEVGPQGDQGIQGIPGTNSNIPAGVVWLWAGSIAGNFTNTGLGINAMVGWALLNGANGTPFNANGRVPIGYDPTTADSPTSLPGNSTLLNYGAIGNLSGELTHILTIAELPTHSIGIETVGYAGIGGSGNKFVGGADTPDITDGNTKTIGSSTPFNVRQPGFVIAYIIKL